MNKTKNEYGVNIISELVRVILSEAEVLNQLAKKVDNNYIEAIEALLSCRGRVVITGVGKSGHIGKKIAATLASTGTAAFFIHSDEAAHGDLGMILDEDIVVCISQSGESEEILKIIPFLQKRNNKIIAITGRKYSTLAKSANICLYTEVDVEAGPLNLAPMKSTTMALVIGDALASVLMKLKKFSKEEFAFNHPAGLLGRKLIMNVADLVTRKNLPIVHSGQLIKEVIMVMSRCHQGCAVVINDENEVKGIFTEGDLCRFLQEKDEIGNVVIDNVMTKEPITIELDKKASAAADIISANRINNLIVINKGKFYGLLHIQELVAKGFLDQ